MLVSHDARLICEAGCELWVVDNKTVTRFDGDFEDYRDQLLDEIEASAEASRQRWRQNWKPGPRRERPNYWPRRRGGGACEAGTMKRRCAIHSIV